MLIRKKVMNKLKELYNKYYYISPLDQADSAESNRLLNLYWSGICFFVALAFLVLELVFKREYYHEHRLQILYMSGACLSIALSFVLSIATKNVSREKACILKTLPFYVIYCWCGTTCPIILFYNQANHYNGLIVFLCATNIVLCIFTASLPLLAVVFASCAAMVPGAVRFFGAYGTFNYAVAVLIIFALFFINRYRLKQRLALVKKQRSVLEAKTFGNFTILHEGKAIKFSRSKTTELVAYLICKTDLRSTQRNCFARFTGNTPTPPATAPAFEPLFPTQSGRLPNLKSKTFFPQNTTTFA